MTRLFTGSGSDHLDLTTAYPLGPPLTISAWYRANTLGVAHAIATLGVTGSNDNRYSILKQAADTVGAAERDTTATTNGLSTVAVTDTTAFHLYVGVFTSHSSRAAFLDGTNKGSNVSARSPTQNPSIIRVGCLPSPSNNSDGYIGHVAIWDIDLSDSDVLALLTNEPRLVQPNHLIHYWPLNGNQSPEPDYGSRGEPLIVSGAPAYSPIEPPPVNWIQEAGLMMNVYRAVAG